MAPVHRCVYVQGGFDCIDFSDNALKKLDNFPDMPDMRTLLASNNLISRVAPDLGSHLKRLDTLVLTNNHIASLTELDNIASFKVLNILST
jgi:U2 small nuclear ribonucleoprotein A'